MRRENHELWTRFASSTSWSWLVAALGGDTSGHREGIRDAFTEELKGCTEVPAELIAKRHRFDHLGRCAFGFSFHSGAMMLVRALGDEALSELFFIPEYPARIALGRSSDDGGRRM